MITTIREQLHRTAHTATVLGAAMLGVTHVLGDTARALMPLALLAAVVIAPDALTAVATALMPPALVIAATVLAAATILAVAALRQDHTDQKPGLLDKLLTRATRLINL